LDGELKSCAFGPVMVEARSAIADLLDNRPLAALRTWTNPRDLAAMYYI
jgi:hypothetical protein